MCKQGIMLLIILKGLFIGLISSAPMGPVGMLCIQRTLNDGRRNGLITGTGAAVGDVIYALITAIGALGLSFLAEYIEKHQAPLQIGGSIVLIVFGYLVFRQNPSRNITRLEKNQDSVGKVFGTSLALTLSNIGMLFLYMALFARFNLIDSSQPFIVSLAVVPAIGLGAMLWWLFITYLVNKLRSKFNPRGLKLFNKIIGTVLMTVGVVGIVTGIYMQVTNTTL